MPTASSITLRETLDLLDGPFSSVKSGVAQGSYAFWLGSGISRDRVIGLDGILSKLIEFLRQHATDAVGCRYKDALMRILKMAEPADADMEAIDMARPATEWPCLKGIISRLWNKYSEVLSVPVSGEGQDFLLWDALDFPATFANQLPDVGHLATAMLALEGCVSDVATANWDGLLEAAVNDLGYDPQTFFRITVDGADLRGPPAASTLYKFHGCALRAIENEAAYRNLLIARNAQIVRWMNNDTFKIVRDQLLGLIQRRQTLMIGLSAQDLNIQNMFAAVGAHQGWKWNSDPTPIVFSADRLSQGQTTVLEVAYGDDFWPNRHDIEISAHLRAYDKQLLTALLLSVLCQKMQQLAHEATAPKLPRADRDRIGTGLLHLRNAAAMAGEADKLSAVKMIAACVGRTRQQLQDGKSPVGKQAYYPIDRRPLQMMKSDMALSMTGQREAANALGLIGIEAEAGTWSITLDDPADPQSGALRLVDASSTTARVFLAANDDNVTALLDAGAFDEADADVVVICSRKVTARQQRSPSGSYRTGAVGLRYISFGPMLENASDIETLRNDFRSEIAI